MRLGLPRQSPRTRLDASVAWASAGWAWQQTPLLTALQLQGRLIDASSYNWKAGGLFIRTWAALRTALR